MRITLSAGVSLALVMVLVQAAPAQKSTNISTIWTFSSYYIDGSTHARLYSDGLQYEDGGKGVTAVVWTSGTCDAVLQVSRPRTLAFNFAGAYLGACSDATPLQWISEPDPLLNPPFFSAALLNIKAMNHGPRTSEYSFSTRLILQILAAPDGKAYNLRMANDLEFVSCATGPVAYMNCPSPTSKVWVHHLPALGGDVEHWDVYPEMQSILDEDGNEIRSSVIGTLLDANRFGTVTCDSRSRGQFSLPFSLRIDVK